MKIKLPIEKPIAIVDVETTGGSPLADRVIEIGILRLEPDGTVETLSSLVNPERYLPHFISELTGIRPEELEKAPVFYDLSTRITDLLRGAVFVAHNARFDYAFIKHEFLRLEVSFSARTLCSVRFSKALYPQHRKHDLSSLIERCGLSMARRHRALDDAQAVLDFFNHVLAEKGEEAFRAAFDGLHLRRLAQSQVPADALGNLPEKPGVYVFHGENDEVLYVGKSKNIKSRVLNHFYEDHQNGKQLAMTGKTHRVDARVTTGELSALLLESELVKALNPIYNRQLKKKKMWVIAVKEAGNDGYLTVRLEEVERIDARREIVGIYPGLKKAKKVLLETVSAHRLCAKIMGLEKTNGACFSHQLKTCFGACSGEETAHRYNARFLEALPRVLKKWPYDGAITIAERDPEEGKGSVFTVDQWKVLQKIEHAPGIQDERRFDAPFDFDVYKILTRALSRKNRALKITPSAGPEDAVLVYERDYSA